MPAPNVLVPWALWFLAAGIGFQLIFAKFLSARAKGIAAFVSCLASLVTVLGTFPAVRDGSAVELSLGAWDGPLACVFHVDALSLLFAFMATGIGAMVLLYSIDYMKDDPGATRFYCILLTFIGGLVTLVYSANLFIFYLGWELVGLCSFNLVGFWYKNPEAVRGARKVLLLTHLAGYGLLAAILTIYVRTGATLWTDPKVGGAMTTGLFVLMVIALAAKSVQFPLHTWIPEAMAAPTPVSALLHAACYVKAGVYLAARMHSLAHWPHSWSLIVVSIGSATMLIGVLYALVQTDLKRLLAFSTVSQIGYMITGIGLGTPLGIAAGLLHCINHGFFKGSLFLAAGSVQHATGTRDMNKLGGLASKMPRTTLVWMISVGSMMGIPLMSGFASKWLVYTAALEKGMILPALAAWIASIGTVFAGVKATSSVFLGEQTEASKHAHESPATMVAGMSLLTVVTVVLGIAPQLAVRFFINPVLASLGMPGAVGVSWFGMTDAMGSWSASMGLVMAVVSFIIGGIVYFVLARPMETVATGGAAFAGAGGGGVFTGGEPLAGPAKIPAGDFSEILKRQWAPLLNLFDVDVLYLKIWGVLKSVSAGLGQVLAWLEANTVLMLAALSAVLLSAMLKLAPLSAVASEGEASIPKLLVAATGVALVALAAVALGSTRMKSLTGWIIASGAPAVAALMVHSPIIRLALLELASLIAVAMIWRTAKTKSAAWAFATMFVISAATLIPGTLALEHGNVYLATALLATGFFLKLGAVPFFLWVPKVAEAVPALVMGTVICVIDIAAFAELCVVAQSAPAVLAPKGLWLGVAAVTAFVAALLMLAERDLKRVLALSTIEDVGFLTLGLVSLSTLGVEGAILGAATHAIAKALLFISLSSPEDNGDLSKDSVALAAKYPVSAAGFLFGMLTVLGVPPTMGFAGRWRLYETAAQMGKGWLTVFIAASILALIGYVRALTKSWWGAPAEDAPESEARESGVSKLVTAALVVILVVAGVLPNLLGALVRGIQ